MYVFWKYYDFNVLFIGLTKNLILNTKCQLKFLLSFHFEKRKGRARMSSSLFDMKQHLVFSIKFDLSNEKNKKFWIKKDNKTLTTLVSTNIILSPSFLHEVI